MTHSWRRGDSCHCRHYTLFCFCFFPLSSSSLTLCCSAGLPPFLLPPPSPQGPDFVEPKLQNCTSWSWRSLPFLFVGLPVLPLWSSWTLGETSWCTDSWGDNSLFFASVRVFFFLGPQRVSLLICTVFPFALPLCRLILLFTVFRNVRPTKEIYSEN